MAAARDATSAARSVSITCMGTPLSARWVKVNACEKLHQIPTSPGVDLFGVELQRAGIPSSFAYNSGAVVLIDLGQRRHEAKRADHKSLSPGSCHRRFLPLDRDQGRRAYRPASDSRPLTSMRFAPRRGGRFRQRPCHVELHADASIACLELMRLCLFCQVILAPNLRQIDRWFGVLRVEILDCVRHDLRDRQIPEPLVVGWNHVPRRVGCSGVH